MFTVLRFGSLFWSTSAENHKFTKSWKANKFYLFRQIPFLGNHYKFLCTLRGRKSFYSEINCLSFHIPGISLKIPKLAKVRQKRNEWKLLYKSQCSRYSKSVSQSLPKRIKSKHFHTRAPHTKRERNFIPKITQNRILNSAEFSRKDVSRKWNKQNPRDIQIFTVRELGYHVRKFGRRCTRGGKVCLSFLHFIIF